MLGFHNQGRFELPQGWRVIFEAVDRLLCALGDDTSVKVFKVRQPQPFRCLNFLVRLLEHPVAVRQAERLEHEVDR